MPTVIVNNQPIEIAAGERLNCVDVAKRAGVEIPAYCYHPSLSIAASCRMCLVEYGDTKPDGTIAWVPKLVPGCQTPVKEGSVIVADSPKVQAARKATLEYLLLNHPLDCPTCDQAGECYLQDYSYRYGRGYSRLQEPKNIKPDKDYIGDQITLFTDRCIMCSRCVRFTREISGTAELQLINRGTHAEVDIFPDDPCNNKLAGNVVDLCPVGALCSKDFLYKQRVWWLKTTDSICSGCSSNCSIHIDQNEDTVYRIRPRTNLENQGYFMCDDGRFGWKYVQGEDRLTVPARKENGELVECDWDTLQADVRQTFKSAGAKSPGRVAAVLSPWMTVEEAYLLVQFIKSVDPQASFFMGPVPIEGVDDQYPKDVHGQPKSDVKFTIKAEKAPNRIGIETVLNRFFGRIETFETALKKFANDEFDAVYLVGGDPKGWITDKEAKSLENIQTVLVQDILPSPALDYATHLFPSGTFVEREGTYVNYKGLAQELRRAVRTPGDAKSDGRLLWELNERPGLFRVGPLREEAKKAIPEFAKFKESFSTEKDNRPLTPQMPLQHALPVLT
ncbi:MAG TPA: molybdopterin-dependent oxidoreductase [Planctomicrobium sp.]|nr:molybdopterin-dependent oxidoreductase [Planctomicrobium sp.]